MATKLYPYSSTEPHVHDFSARNEQNQSTCSACGVSCPLGSTVAARVPGGKGYLDYSVRGSPGRPPKW